MKLIKHNCVQDFLAESEELLLKKESFHSLILGLAGNIRDQKLETTDPLFFSIRDDENRSIAAALRSNIDKPFVITEMPKAAVELLIKDLYKSEAHIKAVVGEEETATYFKDKWIEMFDLDFKVTIHLGVYECFKIIRPPSLTGELIAAGPEHKDILREYVKGFYQDCFPADPIIDENIEKVMNRHLENKGVYFLKTPDNRLVSMAANSRSTLNGGTISLVYTPPALRGKGHASSVVALLSEKIISDGKMFVGLFTDLTNPTSNSIYQKIGYVKIGQNINYDFIDKSHSS